MKNVAHRLLEQLQALGGIGGQWRGEVKSCGEGIQPPAGHAIEDGRFVPIGQRHGAGSERHFVALLGTDP